MIAYDEVTAQLNAWEPDGMMLIGGFFHSPKEWYETMPETDVDKRSLAYLTMLQYAKAHKLPLLGICGGEQMLAGSEGAMMKMGIKGHKIGGEVIAHKVQIEPGKPVGFGNRRTGNYDQFRPQRSRNQRKMRQLHNNCSGGRRAPQKRWN